MFIYIRFSVTACISIKISEYEGGVGSNDCEHGIGVASLSAHQYVILFTKRILVCVNVVVADDLIAKVDAVLHFIVSRV